MSGLLSDAQLASMQATVNTDMPGLATIMRNTTTKDATGADTDSWAAIGMTPCKLVSVTTAEATYAGRKAARETWVGYLPVGTDLTDKDRLVTDGRTFEVTGLTEVDNYGIVLEADLRVQVM